MIYIIFLLLFSVESHAQVFAGYTYGLRLEDSTSGQETKSEDRNIFHVGYTNEDWRFQLQYSTYDISSENGSSHIDSKSYETLAWALYHLPITAAYEIKYYAGGGLGLTWDKTSTTLGSQTTNDTSDREIVLGAMLQGIKYLIPELSIGTDAKVIYSQYYSKRPTFELGLGLSYYF
ncbi:MAG: hypothetical protein KDD37_02845 [Bdellovibrionales bacterium]|nr:hypothetical protein [Bdellovibrionales bacterium]